MVRILLIDNYDSFTYNLEHYLTAQGAEVTVLRNDAIDFSALPYDKILLSPGPGLPSDHPDMIRLIELCQGRIPILGICLGMQAIAEFLGGELGNRVEVRHGVREEVKVLNRTHLFQKLPATFHVGLYHSWYVRPNENYSTDAVSQSDGVLMAISRPDKQLYGVQFHPESILSEYGKELLGAFLSLKV